MATTTQTTPWTQDENEYEVDTSSIAAAMAAGKEKAEKILAGKSKTFAFQDPDYNPRTKKTGGFLGIGGDDGGGGGIHLGIKSATYYFDSIHNWDADGAPTHPPNKPDNPVEGEVDTDTEPPGCDPCTNSLIPDAIFNANQLNNKTKGAQGAPTIEVGTSKQKIKWRARWTISPHNNVKGAPHSQYDATYSHTSVNVDSIKRATPTSWSTRDVGSCKCGDCACSDFPPPPRSQNWGDSRPTCTPPYWVDKSLITKGQKCDLERENLSALHCWYCVYDATRTVPMYP